MSTIGNPPYYNINMKSIAKLEILVTSYFYIYYFQKIARSQFEKDFLG